MGPPAPSRPAVPRAASAASRTALLGGLAIFCAGAADVVVVGAGCAGLSAALEAARGGARVTVVDRASVFGGHAVVAEGGLSFPGTPLQASLGIRDDPDAMYADMIALGEDADPAWVRRYVDRGRADVHDWLVGMGVRFTSLGSVHGSRVPRYHLNPQRGFGVVAPIYRACLHQPNLELVWNTRITELSVAGGAVVGVKGVHERSGAPFALSAGAVVLATGGYQSNLELVKRHWPGGAPPTELMLGAGVNATGSGLALAAAAGGSASRLDHQWNYPRGIPDPRYPGSNRGLSLNRITFPWINQAGVRFLPERTGSHLALRALLEQPGGRAWLVFDHDGKADLEIAGTDWADRAKVEALILRNRSITLRAPTLAALAARARIPGPALARTVARWNRFIAAGEDLDFGRFSKAQGTFASAGIRPPRPIRRAPFYAIAIRPITRKSLGGVRVDLDGRVLGADGRAVPGLYAVGEVTGFGGINGKASIEGTFIAPSILHGRILGRVLGARRGAAPPPPPPRPTLSDVPAKELPCAVCHPVEQLLALARPGYWHFDRVHAVVLERKLDCLRCHAEMRPYHPERHKIDRVAQIGVCATCHLPAR